MFLKTDFILSLFNVKWNKLQQLKNIISLFPFLSLTLQGDSGGPAVNRLCSLWVQSGVKSRILGCALPDLLGVYTRVSEYQQWITGVIKQNLPGFVFFNPPDQCSPNSKGKIFPLICVHIYTVLKHIIL